jgi:hypothetical protein
LSKVWLWHYPHDPRSPPFHCYLRLPKDEEVPMRSCPLSGMVPVRIPISFWSCVRGWHFLSWVRSLALSKWTDGTASFWENFQNHRTLCITHLAYNGRGKFAPHESEVKTERILVLDSPPGPRLNYVRFKEFKKQPVRKGNLRLRKKIFTYPREPG